MIRLKINKDQIKRASELYGFGALKNSITKGESNLYGAVGEIVVFDYCKNSGRRVSHKSTTDYDMIINGNKFDIKTKKTTVPPLSGFNCSVAAFNTTQKCDHYLFVRVMEDYSEAWLLGYIPKGEFFKRATFNRKGQPDPKFPAWNFRADCYNLEVKKLTTIKAET